MTKKARNNTRRIAQSATELAVFGAIVIFIIGLIVRAALHSSSVMNQNLKTMRMALLESYRTAEGVYNMAGIGGYQTSAARNTASIMVFEDRLSVDASQPTGTRDRMPFFSSANTSFSKAMFFPVECPNDAGVCEHFNLPISDVFVNGLRFPFTMGAFRKYNYPPGTGNVPVQWQDDWAGGTRAVSLRLCNPYYAANADLASIAPHGTCYKPDCLILPGVGVVGCTIFFMKTANLNRDYEYSPGIAQRFDLDFNGSVDVPAALRPRFSWQWMPVAGVNHNKFKLFKHFSFDAPFYDGIRGIIPADQINTLFDADGDFREESVYSWETDEYGIVTSLTVMDYQEGDLNTGMDDLDLKIFNLRNAGSDRQFVKVGFQDSMAMHTFTGLMGAGSSLNNAYELSERQVRNTLVQDNFDIVERIFKISNDTGRFCRNGVPVDWSGPDNVLGGGRLFGVIHGVVGMTNPVEACGNCYSGENAELTCLDTETMFIFIRSRVRDQRGHQWITSVPAL